jgi:hypothetical protein
VNYGVARYRQGAVEDAKRAMRQALLRQPGHAAAATNLGAFMRVSWGGLIPITTLQALAKVLRASFFVPQSNGARWYRGWDASGKALLRE